MDRPPPPRFDWQRLNLRRLQDLPYGERQRIDEAASRPGDEQGGAAADAVAQPGMGLEFVAVGMRTVWGRIVGRPPGAPDFVRATAAERRRHRPGDRGYCR